MQKETIGVPRDSIEEMIERADVEMRSAIREGDEREQNYWLGRKAALEQVLEESL